MTTKSTQKNPVVILCPNCGREYLPCEIYYPDEFLGRTGEVIRNQSGQIELYMGKSMNLDQTYCCDGCGVVFNVTARVSFATEIDEEKNVDNPYVEPLHNVKFAFPED